MLKQLVADLSLVKFGDPPVLMGIGCRAHAAKASRCFGVIPTKVIFGRS
jgi:hypothetical protein